LGKYRQPTVDGVSCIIILAVFCSMGGASGKPKTPLKNPNPPTSLRKNVNVDSPTTEQQSTSKHRTQVHLFFGSHGGTAEQFTYALKSTLNSKGERQNLFEIDSFLFRHSSSHY
jgi:hypothetical protein